MQSLIMAEIASQEKFDLHLLAAVVRIESHHHAGAVSGGGACGLVQSLPKYARKTCAELSDAETSLRVGARQLAGWKRKAGTWRKALACYRSGNKCKADKYANAVLATARRYR